MVSLDGSLSKIENRESTRAVVRYARVSAHKARPVLNQIRNKSVGRADEILAFSERSVSDVISGLAICRDDVWVQERFDYLLQTAAEINPDISMIHTAVVRAHAIGGRWDEAENSINEIANPAIREKTLKVLCAMVLTTTIPNKMQRAISFASALSETLDREQQLFDLGFHEVAKHYYFPGWHQPSTMGELMINLSDWNTLSEKQQTVINEACRSNMLKSFAEGEAIQFPALQELQNKGVTLHRWPDETIEVFRTVWEEVAIEEAAQDPEFARVLTSLTEFRKNYKVWGDLGYLD